ncbi:MAG TPA: dephospho-CoA kinase [Streptosporangiaceae bacterium]
MALRTGNWRFTLRVGLTGGIGSGKSEVARRLAAHGAVIIDADVAARKVIEPGTPGFQRVIENFGVLTREGSIDRERLASIVFTEPDRRKILNAIIHPLVGEWMQNAEQTALAEHGPDVVIVHDVPLLTENGLAQMYDKVVVVDVPPELQIARLVAGRKMSPGPARDRIAAQASREDRLAIADIVIENGGSLADLDRRVDEVWAELVKLAQALQVVVEGMSDPRPRVGR